jgi:CheY-like chemotaxis protein
VGTETVLLAEDDELVRNLAVAVLGSAGYRTLAARDGEEALALLEEHREIIDLVVTDVIMPKKSGKDLHDAIRAHGAPIPVLFSSGYSRPALEGKLPHDGSYLMQKPYSPRELLEKVRQVLDER